MGFLNDSGATGGDTFEREPLAYPSERKPKGALEQQHSCINDNEWTWSVVFQTITSRAFSSVSQVPFVIKFGPSRGMMGRGRTVGAGLGRFRRPCSASWPLSQRVYEFGMCMLASSSCSASQCRGDR